MPQQETIECMYTCKSCGLTKIKLRVPVRTTENVKTWLDASIALMGADHCNKSPHCSYGKLDVWVPIEGANKVGGQIQTKK